MFKQCIKWVVVVLCLLAAQPAVAADTRMQVNVVAATEHVEVRWLHANVRKAANLALPQLWARIIPKSSQRLIPKRVKAIRFLEKASPTKTGVRISFNAKRVMLYLKKNNLPYIAQPPALNIVIQLYNQAGRPMRQSANALLGDAARMAVPLGYRLDDQGASLVLLWRWLDNKQVSLSLRGNSKLNEFSETRRLSGVDPLKQLKPWLHDVLLQARDAYAEAEPTQTKPLISKSIATGSISAQMAPQVAPQLASPALQTGGPALMTQPALTKPAVELKLSVQRPASLADQVLFEQALQHDPRILNLSLLQADQEGQQYRLQLKGSDDQWLTLWFARRGMALTPTIEGWVAR
ncbi:hypothetical protein JYT48_01525 [Mariprofundus ferrooxydans]|nr:hypothetical protein [Mariprofundus ferrooxydans]